MLVQTVVGNRGRVRTYSEVEKRVINVLCHNFVPVVYSNEKEALKRELCQSYAQLQTYD